MSTSPTHTQQLKLPTLPNITNIKNSLFSNMLLPQILPQLPRRLQNVLLSKHPRTPVHTQRSLTLGIFEDLYRVVWVSVHGTHDISRLVCADWD